MTLGVAPIVTDQSTQEEKSVEQVPDDLEQPSTDEHAQMISLKVRCMMLQSQLEMAANVINSDYYKRMAEQRAMMVRLVKENAALISEIQEWLPGTTLPTTSHIALLQQLSDAMDMARTFLEQAQTTPFGSPCTALQPMPALCQDDEGREVEPSDLIHALLYIEKAPKAAEAGFDEYHNESSESALSVMSVISCQDVSSPCVGYASGANTVSKDPSTGACLNQQSTRPQPKELQGLGTQGYGNPWQQEAPVREPPGVGERGYGNRGQFAQKQVLEQQCGGVAGRPQTPVQPQVPRARDVFYASHHGNESSRAAEFCSDASGAVEKPYFAAACLGADQSSTPTVGCTPGYLGAGTPSGVWPGHSYGQQGDGGSRQCVTPAGQQCVVGMESVQPRVQKPLELRPLEPGALTLMVRNVPAKYKKLDLAKVWPVGAWSYNMLYLPCSHRGASFGYAFLNFVTPDHTLAFQRRWHGSYLPQHGSTKRLDISQARVQGLAESLHSMTTGVDRVWTHAACSPLVFEGVHLLELEEVIQKFGLEADRESRESSDNLRPRSEGGSASAKDKRSLCYL